MTAGDPAGIGPEIIARSIADQRLTKLGSILIVAEPALFARACQAAGIDCPPIWDESSPLPDLALWPARSGAIPEDFALGRSSAFTGAVAAQAIRMAAAAALDGRVDAIVTAPIAKSALAAAGVPHPGHTEFLAELAGHIPVVMMFVAGSLRVSLATVHIPLAHVPKTLTPEGIFRTIRLTREGLAKYAGERNPRLAVLGLNPHAGEEGLFGNEEKAILRPAITEAHAKGWSVEGPFPADSFFFRRAADYHGVIALYHDQGLIPVKLLSRGLAVNVTLGLPFLRTSVDHGTAFDLAGKGLASADSLIAAAQLAAEWSGRETLGA